MKRKKIIAVLLAFCMVLSFAACNQNKKSTDDTDEETVEETKDTEETEKTEESADEPATSETTESTEATEATKASRATYDGKIVDFDDMHFYVNGKKYTLGQVTLQEMIDDGVPFEEKDLKNASETLKKNSQSFGGFRINLEKFWSAQVSVMNLSDSDKPMSECIVYKISIADLKNEHNSEVEFGFDFPMTLTMEELIACEGKPEEKGIYHFDGDDGYYVDKYTYSKSSELYYGSKDFVFEFQKGVLERIVLEYIP